MYGGNVWRSCMAVMYGGNVWRQCMAVMYGDVWQCMVMYGDNV